MHSKWQVWDFFSSFPAGGWSTLQGKVVLQAFDPLALRLMKDHLLHGVEKSTRPVLLDGPELKADWVEEQFLVMGLFGNFESYVVNRPDETPAGVKDVFLREDLMLDNRVLAFACLSESAFIKKILKQDNVHHVQIEAPRFWETAKLVDFLCSHHRLPLKHEAKQYLLQAVEPEFMPLYDACRLIKLNYPELKEVGLKEVEEVVGVDRLDQFALATEMGKKAWRPFFERLLDVDHEPARLIQVFSFLQGHLLRLADPSYLDGKARLSQYDKEIQGLAKIWRPREVRETLRRLQTWEIAAKTKDPMLLTWLRQARLKVLRGEARD